VAALEVVEAALVVAVACEAANRCFGEEFDEEGDSGNWFMGKIGAGIGYFCLVWHIS